MGKEGQMLAQDSRRLAEIVSLDSPSSAKTAASTLYQKFQNADSRTRKKRVKKAAEKAAKRADDPTVSKLYKRAAERMELPTAAEPAQDQNYKSDWNAFVSKEMKNYSGSDIRSGKAMKEIASKWRKKNKESQDVNDDGEVSYSLSESDGDTDFSAEELSGLDAPIGWIGGKSTVADKIADMLPDHKVYCEPFLGAGHVFFQKEPAQKAVLNDKDPRVADFYKNLPKVNPEKCDIGPDKQRFESLKDKDRFNSQKGKVCDLLYLNKWSYNQKMRVYMKEKKPKLSKVRKHWEKYRARLQDAKVLNQDFATVMDKVDRKGVAFYLDPPYPIEDQDHYKYQDLDPEKVLDAVKGLKGKFLLSYNMADEIRDLFSDFHIRRIKITYTVAARQDGSQDRYEYLISNYKVD